MKDAEIEAINVGYKTQLRTLEEIEVSGLELIKVEPLQDISYEDVQAEGFMTHSSFVRYWDRKHRKETWDTNPTVFVYQSDIKAKNFDDNTIKLFELKLIWGK